MRITEVTSAYNGSIKTVDDVRDMLNRLADQHNTSVDGLLESAKAAGPEALPYQIRAINLQARLEKLEKS